MTLRWGVSIAGLAFLLLSSIPLFPQANQGTIQGSAFDQSGGAIVGAAVTVIDVARGVSRPLTTDSAGAYVASNLIPGTYIVRGEAKGFQTLERSNIVVEVGQTVRVDLVMQPGQQTQTVTVTSEAPTIDTSDTTLGGTIDRETLDALPMNGRNFKNLMVLRPGIALPPGGQGNFGTSANGTRDEDIGLLIDGLRADDANTGSTIIDSPAPLGDSPTNLPIDAIQETNIEANPKAEVGWKPGAIINIGLKSGTNGLHGTGFAYGRDTALDARNYFDVAPLPKEPITYEQFGGSAGGPIKKDKLFWFVDYEGQRYSVGVISPITDPATVSLGPNNATNIASSLVNACQDLNAKGMKISPLSAQIAGLNTTTCAVLPQSYTPGPTESMFPTNTGTASLILDPLTLAHNDNAIAKVDFRPNDHSSITGTYFIGQGLTNGGAVVGLPNQCCSPNATSDGVPRVQLWSGAWNWTPSSTRVNELRIGYNRFNQLYDSDNHNVNPLSYGINTGVTDPRVYGLPMITITGFTGTLGGGQYKLIGPDGSLQLLDHYTLIHGNHTFKVGGEFIYNKMFSYQNGNGKGKFSFSTIENFLQGIVNPGGNAILAGDPTRHINDGQYALFFQDDWRVTRKVMVNLGLRWEYTTVLNESNNLLGGFSPNLGLVQVGKQISSAYNGDHRDFSPRLGVAWDIRGDGKTVLRAGGSVMYAYVPAQMLLATAQVLGIAQTPTGAQIITQATGPAGVAGPGNMAVVQESPSGSALTPGWQAQTTACVTGGTTACGPIFPQSIFNIQCGDGLGKDPGPCFAASVDPNYRNPYVAAWTVGLQRAITNNLSLDLSYVGTHGGNEAGYVDINEPALGSGFAGVANGGGITNALTCSYSAAANGAGPNSGPTCGDPSLVNTASEQAARPYYSKFPYLSYIDVLKNIDRSNYDGLQATLTERFSHGLTFLAGYTYSHALDDDVAYNLFKIPVDSNNPNLDYGNSVFDYRHHFTLTANYALPDKKSPGQILQGWQLNSVVTLESRAPWGPADSTNDFAGDGEISNPDAYGQFWNFSGNHSDFNSSLTPIPCWSGASSKVALPGCSLGKITTGTPAPAACQAAASSIGTIAVATLDQVGCYVSGNSVLFPAALGTNGNAGRYNFRGAYFRNWDMSVTKDWKFKERFGMQFRAEFFNVINHPILAVTVGTGAKFTIPTIGQLGQFGCNCITPDQAQSDLALGTGSSRAIQLALRLTF